MTVQQATDSQLARQPAAYWTRQAYESIIAFTRAEQEKRGYTQPQFWLLRHLSRNDLSTDGHGMTLVELREAMSEYLRPEDDLEAEAAVLLDRGWLRRDDDDRFWLTEAGEAARRNLQGFAPEIRAVIHAGVTDSEYATTIRVLQTLIHNTSGERAPS